MAKRHTSGISEEFKTSVETGDQPLITHSPTTSMTKEISYSISNDSDDTPGDNSQSFPMKRITHEIKSLIPPLSQEKPKKSDSEQPRRQLRKNKLNHHKKVTMLKMMNRKLKLKSSNNDRCKWKKNNVESNSNKLKLRKRKMIKRNKTSKSFRCKRVAAMEL